MSVGATPLPERPDILRVIGRDTTLHRVTKDELAGPCPFCGGEDRFRVNTAMQRCWCRQCWGSDHWGDGYEYMRRKEGISFPEARARIEGLPPMPLQAIAPRPHGQNGHARERGTLESVHDYLDGAGRVVARKCKYRLAGGEKEFRWEHPSGDGWKPGTGGAAMGLYRLPDILRSPVDTPVWVVEGEKDADALAAIGLVATSAPHGAKGGWKPAYTEPLRGRAVALIPDRDDNGEAYARAVTDALKAAAASLVRIDLPAGKDVSDWLAAGGTREQLEAWATPDAPIFEEIGADELDRLEFPALYQPVPGLLYEGATLFSSPPKSGKSITMLGIAAALATGGRALGKIKVSRARVLYLSLEEPQRLTQRRLRTMLGKGKLPADLRLVYTARPLGELVGDIERYVSLYPATRVVVIDTLAHARGSAPRARKDIAQEDYQELVPFSHLGQRLHIAIVLITHSRKGESDDEMESVAGTYGLSGAVDSIIVLRRKRHEPEAALSVFSRELGSEQRYTLRWNPITLSYILEGTAPEMEVTPEQRAVVEFIRANGPECRAGDIARGLGVSSSAASMRVADCVAAGLVRLVRYGVYALSTETIESVETPQVDPSPTVETDDGGMAPGHDDTRGEVSTPLREVSTMGDPRPLGGLGSFNAFNTFNGGAVDGDGRPTSRCGGCGRWLWTRAGREDGGWHCSNCGCEYGGE